MKFSIATAAILVGCTTSSAAFAFTAFGTKPVLKRHGVIYASDRPVEPTPPFHFASIGKPTDAASFDVTPFFDLEEIGEEAKEEIRKFDNMISASYLNKLGKTSGDNLESAAPVIPAKKYGYGIDTNISKNFHPTPTSSMINYLDGLTKSSSVTGRHGAKENNIENPNSFMNGYLEAIQRTSTAIMSPDQQPFGDSGLAYGP